MMERGRGRGRGGGEGSDGGQRTRYPGHLPSMTGDVGVNKCKTCGGMQNGWANAERVSKFKTGRQLQNGWANAK